MFSCKMNKGISNFKNVFDLYGQIGSTEVYFDLKKSGMYIYTTYDKSIHTMATFSNTSFLEYKCDKECIFTLNIKTMKENLKNITTVDTIELTIKTGGELRIKVPKNSIEFEKTIYMKETQVYNLPTFLDQVQPLSVKSRDFSEFCKSINSKYKYSMTVKTQVNAPEIAFESDRSKVIIKSDVNVIQPFEGEFKAEYFSKLKNFIKFNTTLRIYVNPDQPLIFESNIGTKDKDKLTIWIKSLKQMEEEYEDQEV